MSSEPDLTKRENDTPGEAPEDRDDEPGAQGGSDSPAGRQAPGRPSR
jgi:hypothetical protein